MKLSSFISKRLVNPQGDSFSSTISRVAVVSIAISTVVLLVSFMVLKGFKKEVNQKIFSLGGHLVVSKYTLSNSFEETSIQSNDTLLNLLKNNPNIQRFQPYALKAGLLKTKEEVQGIVLKGINTTFDSISFQKNMVDGRFVRFPKDKPYGTEVVLSQYIANYLQLGVGDDVLIYFVQNPPRYRKLQVVGIYTTGLEEFDKRIVLGDIALIRRINNWNKNQMSGMEVFLNDFQEIDRVGDDLFYQLGENLYLSKVTEKYSQLFDWLGLLDKNVVILLVIILSVAATCMISIVLILIMDRTQMIGLFKAIGATDSLIRSVFIWNGMRLVVKGLLIGNLIALGLGFIQYYFKIIPLDPSSYYMSEVPIYFDVYNMLFVNVLTLILMAITLIFPVYFISKINPVKAIRFD